MRKHYSLCMRIVALVCLLSLISLEAAAQWKLLKSLPATHAMFITKSGNMLMSDFDPSRKGGIFISKDKGETWEKRDIADYNYCGFYEFENYVFAIGYAGRIARSADSGETWELINYTLPLKENGVFDDQLSESAWCTSMEWFNGKLYITDYTGGGVLYSEDMGESWKMTDLESLRVREVEGKMYVDNLYNLESFNGKLYLFGAFFTFEFVESDMKWVQKRNDSNFMAQSTVFNNKMYCGRSIMNQTEKAPFLERTADGETWEWVPRPEGQLDNNVRELYNEGKNLYVGLQSSGLYYTDNEGQSWAKISEGLPIYNADYPDQYISPLTITSDDEYLYVAMFEFGRDDSGIYRMAKKDLPPTVTSIDNLSANPDFKVYADESYLYISGNRDAVVSVFDVYGKKMNVVAQDGLANIQHLASGVYVFEISSKDGKAVGKFLKK